MAASHAHVRDVQALEYQMQQGIADGTRHDYFLMPASAQHEYGAELHTECCVIKLLLQF